MSISDANQSNTKINNPVLPGLYADPGITVFGDKFYIYLTTDGFEGWSGTYFKAFSSSDLVNWQIMVSFWICRRRFPGELPMHGHLMLSHETVNIISIFAPTKNIGVAVSESPTGSFSDPLSKPLVAAEEIKDIGGGQAIDPMVFMDDGEAYLYFGNTSLFVAKGYNPDA